MILNTVFFIFAYFLIHTEAGSCYVNPQATGVTLIDDFSCPLHFYCPNTTSSNPQSKPQYCPADLDCQFSRLIGRPCSPQGEFEPQACPAGSYCPDFRTKIICPAGSFCPTGSVEPMGCPVFSVCEQGATRRLIYSGIIWCLIVDSVLAIIFFALKHRRKFLMSSQSELYEVEPSIHHDEADSELMPVEVPANPELPDSPKTDLEEKKQLNDTPQILYQYYKRVFENIGSKIAVPAMEFRFGNLGYTLSTGQKLLQGVTGTIYPGKLTAIMGPSGAGKTTFMNVLMGKLNRTSGTLSINGQEVEINKFKRSIGYVPQEDIMIRELTVREIIRFSARIRLPRHWPNKDIEDYVDAVLKTLWHIQHCLIGDEATRGISGGQRKRVNIGMELAAAPLAIFADEPTSGLDSTAALKVVATLKKIASLGVTVITVLHQPRYEIFESFDDILLIAPGGLTAYFGPCKDVVNYFKKLGFQFDPFQNPADVLMDIVSGKGKNALRQFTPNELVHEWDKSANLGGVIATRVDEKPPADQLVIEMPKEVELPNSAPVDNALKHRRKTTNIICEKLGPLLKSQNERPTASWIHQVLLVHNRSMVQQYRRVNSLILEIFTAGFAGGLMGLSVNGMESELFRGIYVEPMSLISPSPSMWLIPMLTMNTAVACGVAGAPAGVRTFGEERSVYWREAAAGHSRSAYYVGKILSVLYRFVITSLHFSAIYFVLGKSLMNFWDFFSVVLLLFYCIYGLASNVSMLSRPGNATLLGCLTCLFSGVFSGFGPTLTKARQWHLIFIWDISPARWAAEAIFSSETAPYKGVYELAEISTVYGYEFDRFASDLLYMFLIGSVLRVIAYILMVFTHRDKQK